MAQGVYLGYTIKDYLTLKKGLFWVVSGKLAQLMQKREHDSMFSFLHKLGSNNPFAANELFSK